MPIMQQMDVWKKFPEILLVASNLAMMTNGLGVLAAWWYWWVPADLSEFAVISTSLTYVRIIRGSILDTESVPRFRYTDSDLLHENSLHRCFIPRYVKLADIWCKRTEYLYGFALRRLQLHVDYLVLAYRKDNHVLERDLSFRHP